MFGGWFGGSKPNEPVFSENINDESNTLSGSSSFSQTQQQQSFSDSPGSGSDAQLQREMNIIQQRAQFQAQVTLSSKFNHLQNH